MKFICVVPMILIEGTRMTDRTELLEAALDALPEGMALADLEGHVVFWNDTAQAITGHRGADLIGRSVREVLDETIAGGTTQWIALTKAETANRRGLLIHTRHRLGHDLPVMGKILVLRDRLGTRIGTGVTFHPVESLDALPHGERDGNSGLREGQAELEDRLASEFEDFVQGDAPLGVLWISVDQAHSLRSTHGTRACEAMIEGVEETLANGLKPTEEIARWGDDEFLVLSHQRNAAMLAAHAQVLAGLARTTDFRWWGDRITLTVKAFS
jgi:PAS domain S-box-containing protein